MSNRKIFILRTVAILLVLIFITEVVFPTAAYALTSGPTTPEVYGFQPSDATDNVSLGTGDFNYTIPITSIPEYPMAIGYSSNGGMDQEATIFGFGVNGFSGAIARSMQGIPDDVSGGTRNYNYENQPNFRIAGGGTISDGLFGTDFGESNLAIGVGASVSLKVGYDNYKGMFGAVGLGINIGAKLGQEEEFETPLSAGLGINLNSDYGFTGGAVISYGDFFDISAGTDFKRSYINATYKNRGVATYTSGSDNKLTFDMTEQLKTNAELGITSFPASQTVSSSLAPLASIIAPTNSFGLSITVPLPLPPPSPSISLTAEYNHSKSGKMNETKSSYGFMYLKNYNRRDYSHVADFSIEGERSFDDNSRNNPSVMQRDVFIVNSQGISGSMQLHQDQYGVVSRNYQRINFRDVNLLGMKTDRKEVERWTHVGKAHINKQLDLIKVIKNAANGDAKENDFDNTIFIEKDLLSMTTSKEHFDNPAKFKMRGDMAGEFNLSSSKFNDYKPNSYEVRHITGTGFDRRLFFLGEEKEMPHYYPRPSDSTSRKYNGNNTIKNSTSITHYTIGQVIAAHPETIGLNPNENNAASYKFNESFLSHERYVNTYAKQDVVALNGSNVQNFNILSHLNSLRTAPYVDDLVADVRVKTAEGLSYIYNLPAFNHVSKTLMLRGKGQLPPVSTGDNDYHSFLKENNNPKERDKVKVTEDYKYPYAWMLTAIVGPDYIDFDDIPGPSEGDLGSWVKFKYVKAADHYRWRNPFNGMTHNAGAIHTTDDDMYMVSTGLKEIYYISEIESGNHVSKFHYSKRFDAVDANGADVWNGTAHNSLNQLRYVASDPTGNNFQFAVTKVELYKKNYEGDNSSTRQVADKKGKLIRATEFKYDYSVCPNTPNNLTVYKGLNPSYDIKTHQLDYHIRHGEGESVPIGTGKLTLRKVRHISYEGNSNGVFLPSYELKYGFDGKNYDNTRPGPYEPEWNPAYNSEQVDHWGNYSKEAMREVENPDIKNPADGAGPLTLYYYNHYAELEKTQADKNAKAFKLSGVLLPGGGSINVDFEAKSYSKVQDKTAFVMRKVNNINYDHPNKLTTVCIDITDLSQDGKTLDDIMNTTDHVYGEVAYYESNNPSKNFPAREDQLFVSTDHGEITNFGSTLVVGDRVYQYVTVKHPNPVNAHLHTPFLTPFKQYWYLESNKMKAVRERLVNNCDLELQLHKYETLEKDGPLDAARKVVTNLRNYFKVDQDFESKMNTCYGDPSASIFDGYSFIRTPVYKEKFTGSRVKSIAFADNFRYATNSTGDTSTRENIYRTNYFYDEKGDGTGISEGAATIEPGGGASCVFDIYSTTGASFFPSPAIIYAKTTMETGYKAPAGDINEHVSRKKGKIEYHFYSPKDQEYKFVNNFQQTDRVRQPGAPAGKFFMFGIMTWLIIKFKIFRKKITIKIPLPLPLSVKWKREDHYHVKSYSYADHTDIYGKLKKVVQLSADGKEVARNEFKYHGRYDSMAVYNGAESDPGENPFDESPAYMKLGRMDQVWSEAYYTNESSIHLIPALLFMNARSRRDFAYTNMKYTYVPPVLKEVTAVNSLDGSITSSRYTAFDYYTGQALQVENKDSYKNTKIHRIMPAYWKYPQMGPLTSANPENLNLLTQATGNFVYLNSVSDNNVLSAGITEWTRDSIPMISAVRNLGKQFDENNTTFRYAYEVIGGDTLEKIYNTNGKSRVALDASIKDNISSRYIPAAGLMFRPFKTYTYDVQLNSSGTFSSYTPFDYSHTSQAAQWKLLNTNTLFDMYGNVVESKDILDKYATAHFGYNFSYSTAAVGNSGWKQSAYAGGENVYAKSDGGLLLDDHRIQLQDAELVKDCERTFTNRTFDYNDFTDTAASVLTVCIPSSPDYNKAFAKMDIVYSHNTSIKRSLFISMDENKDFRIMSDKGEVFTGFYTLAGGSSGSCSTASYKLVFDPRAFASFSKDNSFPNSGYAVVQSSETLPACSMPVKEYKVPNTNCFGTPHTGSQGFALKGNGKGTRFEIDLNALPPTEAGRKYKAMVWVHAASPQQTSLVVADQNGDVIKSTSLAMPYMKAGSWYLLRTDVDYEEYNALGASKLVFYIHNNTSAGTAVYDDLRILPYHASMENYVYDHATGRVIAKLDNENIATFFRYDSKGRLVEVKAEIENIGMQTIKKYQYNEQKNN